MGYSDAGGCDCSSRGPSETQRWAARYGRYFKYDKEGPWAGVAGHDEEDQRVLDIYDVTTGQVVFRGHWGNHARAKLAAAAPELLEALIALAGIAGDQEVLGEECYQVRAARAAIAKARGES